MTTYRKYTEAEKTSAGKRLGDWYRFISSTFPKMSDPAPRMNRSGEIVFDAGYERSKLMLYCYSMVWHGSLGKGCHASDGTIARESGMKRDTVSKYRRLALELGWFKLNGRVVNRVPSVDIAFPDETTGETSPTSSPKVAHELNKFAEHCTGCQSLATVDPDTLNMPRWVVDEHDRATT
jgi:hypothetical protein